MFRRAILEPGPPENFALSTVQEVIKPQVLHLSRTGFSFFVIRTRMIVPACMPRGAVFVASSLFITFRSSVFTSSVVLYFEHKCMKTCAVIDISDVPVAQ